MKSYNIPVEATLDLIGGKWKVVILCHLKERTSRFRELQQVMPDVSKKMLSQALRELEADGLLHRYEYPVVPKKVEYSLTEKGETLRPILNALCAWGKNRIEKTEQSPEPMVR